MTNQYIENFKKQLQGKITLESQNISLGSPDREEQVKRISEMNAALLLLEESGL